VLAVVKVALVGSIVAVGWADAATSAGSAVPPVVERQAARDAALSGGPAGDAPGRALRHEIRVHRCSVVGFRDGRTPRSALVRTPAGRLRHVSFDAGWRVYTTHGAATLVAVCLDAPPSGAT
jgi:hypothetical protein